MDDSVPVGVGPRFTLGASRTSGSMAEEVILIVRSRPEEYRVLDHVLERDDMREYLLNHPRHKTYVVDREGRWAQHWYLEDSWARQAKEKWVKGARGKYVITREIGEFRFAGETANIDGREAPEKHRVYRVAALMRGPDGREFYARVRFAEPADTYLRHEMMYFAGRVRLDVYPNGPVLVQPGPSEGYSIRWHTQGGKWVYIGTTGVYPEPVVKAYLEKYPSALPPDFQYDRNEWGREHVDIAIAKLKASLALPHHGPQEFISHLRWLAMKVSVSFREQVPADASREELEGMLRKVEEWARESRERLVWSPEKRKFVVGEGPAEPSPLVSGRTSARGSGHNLYLGVAGFAGLAIAGWLCALAVLRRRRKTPG